MTTPLIAIILATPVFIGMIALGVCAQVHWKRYLKSLSPEERRIAVEQDQMEETLW